MSARSMRRPRKNPNRRTTMSIMDVRQQILKFLVREGCSVREEHGIVYVTTPDGKVWDFTAPRRREDEEQPNG
jgi:hypothetical protein